MADQEAGKAGYELVPSAASPSSVIPMVNTTSNSSKGVVLEWNHVLYAVPTADGSKTLLNNLYGVAYPGEILAILGTSGAGKSTLLDVLAGRLEAKQLQGALLTNGTPVDKRKFRREIGYVMQSDALFPLLTVRETIRYAAYLRIHDKTREEKNEVAENVIKLLRLESCADTICGDDLQRGISGGQKRRVSIGVDIVHQPKVIFLDEPTSGLDSNTALSVVESLKAICVSQNSTVVMTIHQPSSRLFDLLDKVMFLASGNLTFYGSSTALISHTAKIYNEAGLGVPPTANPPELFLDLCDTLVGDGKLEMLTNHFGSAKAHEDSAAAASFFGENEEVNHSYANNLFSETAILFERAFVNFTRTPELFFARLGASVGFGVMLGTLFLFTDESLEGLQHRTAYFVFIIAFYMWTSLEALPIFLAERETFQREYSSGAYRALSYTISSWVVTMPFHIIIAFVFSCITWWLVGLPNLASCFFFHVFTVFVILITGSTFATMVSVLVPNPMAGQTAGSALFSVMFLYSGFFIKRSSIPKYWIYLHYMSLFKYAYDSLLVNVFYHLVESTDPVMDNYQVLAYFGITDTNRWQGVFILVGWALFYRSIFYYRLVTAFNGSRKA